MQKFRFAVAFAAALAIAAPAVAQSPLPGAPDVSRVAAGRYQVDTDHTLVVWTVNHMGISPLSGAIAASGGTLELDPVKPAAAKVAVTFKVENMTTTVPAFTQHLRGADFFEADKHPTVGFASTAVEANGHKAKITGNLTIKGVTRPVTLDADFYGAGTNPMSKKLEVGFTATAKIKRSEFGLGFGLPVVTPDLVDLRISAAFRRAE
jgi:polyisoprenoid-binding protein YceI